MTELSALKIGHGTDLQQFRRGAPEELSGFDHAWKVMFAYEGPHAAIETVRLGPIPGEFPSDAVRQLLIDKHAASEESMQSALSRTPKPSGDKCVLCRLAFGAEYDDPGLGKQTITRNRRNRFYCNICDMFIRACPGQTTLEMPVLVVDVQHSRQIRNRPDVTLSNYARMLSAFHRRVSAIVQVHLGFVLNTLGDAVIAVWPSGFIPTELRDKYGWDVDNPAKISAKLAIAAVEGLAKNAPREFEGGELPYRGALDTTEMAVFTVQSDESLSPLEFTDLDTSEVGIPLIDDQGYLILGEAGVPGSGAESEYQTGPAATDIAGEAVEVASELASHRSVQAGEFCVTRRTDIVAGKNLDAHNYSTLDVEGLSPSGLEARMVSLS